LTQAGLAQPFAIPEIARWPRRREEVNMGRQRIRRSIASLALGAALAGASFGVAAADPVYVTVTDVTFDRVATLCNEFAASGCVRLTGTITCAEAGLPVLVEIFLRQGDITGGDNLDLLDFACSPVPRAFLVHVEFDGCSVPGIRNPAGCFKPGPATAVAQVFRGEVLTEQRVLVRKRH
jgi:hypothetical protein